MYHFFIASRAMARLQQRETLLGLALALQSDLSLSEALSAVVEKGSYIPFRRVFLHALEVMALGGKPADAFGSHEARALPGPVRAVLGSALEDGEKGLLLAGMADRLGESGFAELPEAMYLVSVLFFIMLQGMAMLFFVFPQFREILRTVKIALPWSFLLLESVHSFFKGFGEVGNLVLFGALCLATWLFFRFAHFLLGPTRKDREWAQIFDLLAELPPERRIPVLDILAHKALFPRIVHELTLLRTQLANVSGFRPGPWSNQLPPVIGWCSLLPLAMPGNLETFSLLGDFLRQRAAGRGKRILLIMEQATVITLGLLVLAFAGTCVQCMSLILESSF